MPLPRYHVLVGGSTVFNAEATPEQATIQYNKYIKRDSVQVVQVLRDGVLVREFNPFRKLATMLAELLVKQCRDEIEDNIQDANDEPDLDADSMRSPGAVLYHLVHNTFPAEGLTMHSDGADGFAGLVYDEAKVVLALEHLKQSGPSTHPTRSDAAILIATGWPEPYTPPTLVEADVVPLDGSDPTEPQEEDYVTRDYVNWWSHGHGPIKDLVTTPDDWMSQVIEHQRQNNYFPNIWVQNERGPWDQLILDVNPDGTITQRSF